MTAAASVLIAAIRLADPILDAVAPRAAARIGADVAARRITRVVAVCPIMRPALRPPIRLADSTLHTITPRAAAGISTDIAGRFILSMSGGTDPNNDRLNKSSCQNGA